MGKGSRGGVAWKRERTEKVKEKRRKRLAEHVKRWKAGTERRMENDRETLGKLARALEQRRKEFNDSLGKYERGEWEERYLRAEGQKVLKLLESLNEIGFIQAALHMVQDAEFTAGVAYLLEKRGATLDAGVAPPKKVIAPAKAEPTEVPRKGKAGTANGTECSKMDKKRLLDLSKTVEKWRTALGSESTELFDNAMKILKELSNADAAYMGKTALMRCAEKGFLPGVKYLIEERKADRWIEGRVGTAQDYALAVSDKGYRHADAVIMYFGRLGRETETSRTHGGP